MSTFFKEGDTPNATELNDPYTQVSSFTIDSQDCARDWSTRIHFNTSGDDINDVHYISGFAGAAYTTTSATYSTVTNGATNAQIVLNKTESSDTLLRIQWDTLVGALTLTDDKSPYSDNIYVFRIKVLLNSGAITKYASAASYSYSARSYATTESALTLGVINWRSCSGVGVLVIDSGVTVDSVTLEAATGGAGANTLVVERFNLVVLEARQ
tara:strand:+ start:140 stop:775 length:636 start_codon:yes stop_codon:yes gene_type:complete